MRAVIQLPEEKGSALAGAALHGEERGVEAVAGCSLCRPPITSRPRGQR